MATGLTKKVLLVEDDIDDAFLIRKTLHDYLCARSFQVVHCDSMTGAKRRIENNGDDIEIILLDLNLPDTSGARDTFLHIKSHAHDIPIIVLTGADDQKMALDLIADGAEDFLNKNTMQKNPELLRRYMDFAMYRHQQKSDIRQRMQESEAQKEMLMSWMGNGYSMAK